MKERAVSIISAPAISQKAYAIFGCAAGNPELFVKAFDGSRPQGSQWLPSQAGWTALGGAFDSTIAPVMRGGQFVPSIDLFGIGLDNAMYHGVMSFLLPPSPIWPPAQVTWPSTGGIFNGPPAALAYGNSLGTYAPYLKLVAVGVGTDNQAYASGSFLGGPPSQTAWAPIGGKFISELFFDTSSTDLDKFGVLGLGTDAQLYRQAVDATNWPPVLSGWAPQGGCFRGSPVGVSWGAARLDVFGLGNDLAMFHRAWNNGTPVGGWESLGGEFDSSPAVVAWGPNRLDVFGLGTDDAMYHKAWNGSQWLPSATAWEPLGGTFTSAPAAVSLAANRLDIVGLGTDNAMYHKAWDGSQWLPSPAGWENIGGVFSVPRPTVMPGQLDFSAQVTFPGSTAAGGSIHLTLFSNGKFNFSGHMHDSGGEAYNFTVACAVTDSRNRAYVFSFAGSIAGTFEPGSRDDDWGGVAGPNADLAAHWTDLFGCGGAKFKWDAQTNTDLTGLLASIVFPGALIIDVTSK